MEIEKNSEPFRRENDKYGKPLFVHEIRDATTGVIRRIEKSIFSEQGGIFFSQTDTFSPFGLIRLIRRNSSLLGEDLSSQYLSGVYEEEVVIRKIGSNTDRIGIFGTRYDKDEEIKIESVSFVKELWNGIGCGVFYNDNGEINEIVIEPNLELVEKDEESYMVRISLPKNNLYFEVIDINKPVREEIIEVQEIKFLGESGLSPVESEVFESRDFSCVLEDSKDKVLLRIEHKKLAAGKRTISLSKSVDVDKLYAIAATDGFTGWEKVLAEVDKLFFVSHN